MKVYCINRATAYSFSLFEFEGYGTATTATAARTAQAASAAAELQGLAIYPNPASDQLNVRLAPSQPDGHLTLSNHLGQVVRRQDLAGGETKLGLQGLATGIYLLTLTDSHGQVTRKVSKQ